jgi:thiamine pyrophosphokinase
MKSRPESALLMCNGEPPSRGLARKLASQADLVIAADGGANVARRYHIQPDIIIGDLDSIKPTTKRAFSYSEIIHVSRQDNTDLEKALDFLKSRGIKDVSIVGATGRRIDFTLGNLSVIWNYANIMRLALIGNGWKAMPVQSGKRIKAKRGTVVSLIPFGPCRGVTLQGLRYPLVNASMKVGDIGVSNVVSKSPFSVSVRTGKMLLFIMDTLA